MDFTPTPGQEMARKQVRELAVREIGPVATKSANDFAAPRYPGLRRC